MCDKEPSVFGEDDTPPDEVVVGLLTTQPSVAHISTPAMAEEFLPIIAQYRRGLARAFGVERDELLGRIRRLEDEVKRLQGDGEIVTLPGER